MCHRYISILSDRGETMGYVSLDLYKNNLKDHMRVSEDECFLDGYEQAERIQVCLLCAAILALLPLPPAAV